MFTRPRRGQDLNCGYIRPWAPRGPSPPLSSEGAEATRGRGLPKVIGQARPWASEGTRRSLFQPLPSGGHGCVARISLFPSASKLWGSTRGDEEGPVWGAGRGEGLPGAKIT